MRQSVKPLIECQWSQSAPFNGKLKYKSKYQLVGCTALAIAQIMYYWMVQKGYHRGCKATPKYTTATNQYAVEALPPITVFDWKSLVAKPKTAEQKAAVATLCEYIAKALRSDFGRSATSAQRTLVETILNTYLRMGNSKHVYRSIAGKPQFEELIYNEIVNGRPVYMSSTSSGGHSFVIDGYDAESGKYHVNWGWGGDYDGYFTIGAFNPSNLNYSGSLMAVVNIQPLYLLGDANGDGKINISDIMTVINTANKGRATKQTDINSDGKVTIDDAKVIEDYLVTGDGL